MDWPKSFLAQFMEVYKLRPCISKKKSTKLQTCSMWRAGQIFGWERNYKFHVENKNSRRTVRKKKLSECIKEILNWNSRYLFS